MKYFFIFMYIITMMLCVLFIIYNKKNTKKIINKYKVMNKYFNNFFYTNFALVGTSTFIGVSYLVIWAKNITILLILFVVPVVLFLVGLQTSKIYVMEEGIYFNDIFISKENCRALENKHSVSIFDSKKYYINDKIKPKITFKIYNDLKSKGWFII